MEGGTVSKVPGITAKHAIITPTCRTVARPHLDSDPRMAAFEEAVGRLREEYRAICDGNGEGDYRLHLVLAFEPSP